ncbi:hypothetical protein [Aquabacter cavernae]|uniref:hypothetical protein n=1 Tax=Aquabacter cavernae TaxID=2496029 RepID=UPI000F8DF861|nr:hypothetical protein [Aquabacter cavernae]
MDEEDARIAHANANALEEPAFWHALAVLTPMSVMAELIAELIEEGVLKPERAKRLMERFDFALASWDGLAPVMTMKEVGPPRARIRRALGE